MASDDTAVTQPIHHDPLRYTVHDLDEPFELLGYKASDLKARTRSISTNQELGRLATTYNVL